ncbi:MAG: hypothetical protein GQ580_03855 [Candidatus Thorarchaeota archaeon]|nr:hypothetical protein [Candidatus Thorarchaeota archaeon]
MEINVRLATAHDRTALEEFYSREGIRFHDLSAQNVLLAQGATKETMYVVAVAGDLIVASLKLDVKKDPSIGLVGHIQHFEIEDELEETILGTRMLQKIAKIAEEKGLRALDTIVSEKRADMIKVFLSSGFEENHKEVHLRKDFRARLF